LVQFGGTREELQVYEMIQKFYEAIINENFKLSKSEIMLGEFNDIQILQPIELSGL